MTSRLCCVTLLLFWAAASWGAAPPANLVADGIPAVPEPLVRSVSPWLDYRTASLADWHPQRREILISTRFANTSQLHRVAQPGGARKQITFETEPVGSGSFAPGGDAILYLLDRGGSEFYQIWRLDLETGETTLLTDGESRNGSLRWSTSGGLISFTSTRRNGRSNDVWVMDPSDSESATLVVESPNGSAWSAADWSEDDSLILVGEYVSANESNLYLFDRESGELRPLTPQSEDLVSWSGGEITRDGTSVITTTDLDSEFERLARIDIASGKVQILTSGLSWDVQSFKLQPKGSLVAFLTNEAGVSRLHLLDLDNGREVPVRASLPDGVLSGLEWRPDGKEIAFEVSSARSPGDVFSMDIATGTLERWTESETGGVDPSRNAEPQLVQMAGFDGTPISAFVYRPDPRRFPGPRPAVIQIHGGPEGQSRPGFLGSMNYLINQMGIALIRPNVRGSSGYGKSFLLLDNGFKREDSVKDIGTIIDWARKDDGLDGQRIAVYGGSYGGYMVLASLLHFGDRLRAGIDVVGISDFVTFLENTQDYRRDLRRMEYGDERDPEMRRFLTSIAPARQAEKIRTPLFVIQGANDPRVPASESEQIVKAVRANQRPVWYLLAKDEGHGFRKKENRDYQFYTMVMFLEEHLVSKP